MARCSQFSSLVAIFLGLFCRPRRWCLSTASLKIPRGRRRSAVLKPPSAGSPARPTPIRQRLAHELNERKGAIPAILDKLVAPPVERLRCGLVMG